MSSKPQKTVTTADSRCEYWTTTKTIRGAWVASDYFAVPVDECHGDSCAEISVMRAMMKAAASDDTGLTLRDVLVDAGKKMAEPMHGPTQYWTALGFFNMVADCFLNSTPNRQISDFRDVPSQ